MKNQKYYCSFQFMVSFENFDFLVIIHCQPTKWRACTSACRLPLSSAILVQKATWRMYPWTYFLATRCSVADEVWLDTYRFTYGAPSLSSTHGQLLSRQFSLECQLDNWVTPSNTDERQECSWWEWLWPWIYINE